MKGGSDLYQPITFSVLRYLYTIHIPCHLFPETVRYTVPLTEQPPTYLKPVYLTNVADSNKRGRYSKQSQPICVMIRLTLQCRHSLKIGTIIILYDTNSSMEYIDMCKLEIVVPTSNFHHTT